MSQKAVLYYQKSIWTRRERQEAGRVEVAKGRLMGVAAVVDFNFDLDEMVAFGGREVSLRQALAEYLQAKKQAGASGLVGPICFRHYGKRLAWLDGRQMEQILASIPSDDLSRGDD
jgi:hypothetical protein